MGRSCSDLIYGTIPSLPEGTEEHSEKTEVRIASLQIKI